MEYSMVIPIYKDGYLARACAIELERTFQRYLGTQDIANAFELIFVNDGSPDNSLDLLLSIQAEFPFIKVVDLSRNFGQHAAIACGFQLAEGKYVMRMNVDCQDPPAELPKLLTAIRTDKYDLVIGQYSVRNSPMLNKLTSFLYFEFFRIMTGLNAPQQTSPMRVMNRSFIDVYNRLTEKARFPQGLDQWLGFRHHHVEITHHDREDGKSSYSFRSRLRLALTGILYFSDRPLKLIGTFGVFIAMVGMLLGLAVILQKLTGHDILPGYASLAAIGLLGFGMQMGSIGVLGLYLGRVFTEVQNRPLYIVRSIFQTETEQRFKA